MTSPMPSSGFLIDTNVISELAKPQPNPGVTRWGASVQSVSVSAVSLEEIFFGLALKPNVRIRGWFETFVETYCRILPLTAEIAKSSGSLRGRLASRGKVRTQADMLIAATAQIHQLTLVTRNVRDFEECGIALLNPFS